MTGKKRAHMGGAFLPLKQESKERDCQRRSNVALLQSDHIKSFLSKNIKPFSERSREEAVNEARTKRENYGI